MPIGTEAAKDALLFRAERYRLYPNAAAQEHGLEQDEGLAEYTGVRVGNPTAELQTEMALHDLSAHVSDATFVRSFAYATGPRTGCCSIATRRGGTRSSSRARAST